MKTTERILSAFGLLILIMFAVICFLAIKFVQLEDKLSSIQAATLLENAQDAPRVSIDINGAPVRGNDEAPITIVEFSDFECIFCKQAQSTLNSLLNTYGDQVKLVFKHFPLGDVHKYAVTSALASMCAYEQNKFWEYHDSLFENSNDSGSLHPTLLKTIANEHGLNMEQFHDCLDRKKYLEAVKQDYEEGFMYNVTGTPTFFINGRMLQGNQDIEEFKRVIEEELALINQQG